MHKRNNYTIFGTGSWGTAIANMVSMNYGKALIYGRDENIVKDINEVHCHKKSFPNNKLSKNLRASTSLEESLESNILMIAIPCQNLRGFLTELQGFDLKEKTIILCCKGLENDKLKFPREIVEEFFPKTEIGLLSGPNFAVEVINKLPTASVIALNSLEKAEEISKEITGNNFFVHQATDLINIETSSAIKNIIAIMCGIVAGLGFGQNAISYIIALSLEEIISLAKKRGGDEKNINVVAVIGDLILTCNSEKSRNFSFGYNIGKKSLVEKDILLSGTVEGYHSTKSVFELSNSLRIEMKIVKALYKILYQNAKLEETILSLFEAKK